MFKVGDRYYYIGPENENATKVKTGTITRIDEDGTMYGHLDSDTDSYKSGGPRFYGKLKDNYIVPQEIFESPLFKLMQEEELDTLRQE